VNAAGYSYLLGGGGRLAALANAKITAANAAAASGGM